MCLKNLRETIKIKEIKCKMSYWKAKIKQQAYDKFNKRQKRKNKQEITNKRKPKKVVLNKSKYNNK